MSPTLIVLLVSLGSFQAQVPGLTKTPSPVFEDNEQGLRTFTAWARATMGEPRFNQPPHHICVVGAVPFVDRGPFIAEPISKSRMPVRQLEPYAATFHYVDASAAPAPKAPRTWKQAVDICKKTPRP